MNKWKDSHGQSFSEVKNCFCKDNQGLYITNRQLSFIVAGMIFIVFSIFITGYFLGKKSVIEQYGHVLRSDVSANINCAIDDFDTLHNENENRNALSLLPENMTTEKIINEIALPLTHNNNTHHANNVDQNNAQHYYAQLIGFGTEKAAQLFVKKLAAKGIETELKKRVSKTVKGRSSYWYQVVTTTYSDKNELDQLINRIAKEENIKDICVRNC
ncbi:MAG TPA: SPOR domain-containing protein [Candidatus Babeliales bacterium]|nr:SPOR domain-containing protein [Candidatus Babeliales bacterium]